MRTTLLAVLLGCITLLHAQSASNEMSIRAFTRDYMAAYNRQDIAALTGMYTADAIAVLENKDTIRGAEELARRFEDHFIRYETTLLMKYADLNWSDAQQAWIARGTYEGFGSTYVYDIPFHKVTAYANTMVEEGGRWKIARSVVTPLVRTLIYQKAKDAGAWKSVLLDHLKSSTMLTHETGTMQNDPGAAYALLQWPSLEAAQEFLARTDWKNALRRVSASGGKAPVVVVLP